MILGLQIIAIIFSLVMIYFADLHYRRKEITPKELAYWMLIWIGVIVIVIFPELLRQLSEKFFITRLFDFVVVGGFIFLITITSWQYLRTKRLENKIEKMVREESLKQVRSSNKLKVRSEKSKT